MPPVHKRLHIHLDTTDLSERVVALAVLLEAKEGEFTHQFAAHRAGQDVQRQL
jgi:hypothetical protein